MHFTPALILAAAALPAVFVGAQSTTASSAVPTSTSGIDPCILQCVTQAASSAGCSSFADLQCVCTSQTFQDQALSCLQSNCPSGDLATAQALQQQQCASISSVSSNPASSVLSSLSSAASSLTSNLSSRVSSASSVLSSVTNASTSSSAAGNKASFGTAGLIGAAVSVFGIAVGVLMV